MQEAAPGRQEDTHDQRDGGEGEQWSYWRERQPASFTGRRFRLRGRARHSGGSVF
jgi:hypothetical protein